MVNHLPDLDRVFAALADPIRRQVVEELARGERPVTELHRPHDISLPAFLKHLRVLEEAGLLASEKTGRVRRCRVEMAALSTAADWIERHRAFWEGQLDSLGRYLEETKKENSAWPPRTKRPSSSKSVGRTARPPRRSTKPGPGPKQ
ncbi:MAG: metalloregulator ArsR/SmtB family transcription factor [Candidatus Eisenbacteria bacterium]